jgi:signal transduction histidine kinase
MPYRLGNWYSVALLLVTAFNFALAAVALRHWDERASKPLFGFLVALGLWAGGDALRLAALTESGVLLWNRVAYLGTVFVPPTLVLFIASYTGRRRWLQRRYVAGLAAVSLLAYGVVLTNPMHSLWIEIESITPGTAPPVLSEDWGALWYVWATYVYGVVVFVTYLMGREFVTASRSSVYRSQTGLVLTGLLVASGVNALFVVDAVPFDPTPFTFTITGLTFGVAIFRYQLLTLLPIARDTVVTEMDSGVLVLDADDRVVDVNDQLRSMFDLGDEAIRGAPVRAVFECYPAITDHLGGARETRTVSVEVDGSSRHYDVEISRLHDAVETDVGRVVVFTDVTRRVSQREQLQARTAELEQANDRLDQFASVVSHDLRNPLQIVGSRVELARRADDPEPHLDSVEDAAGRMQERIEDLLTLARQGKTIGDETAVDLETVSGAAWDIVETPGATLSVETDRTVVADPGRLQELFENLFHNAVEHGTPDEQPQSDGGVDSHPAVTVRVGALDSGFFVADDGPGIPEDKRDTVFEAGYTTDSDGTGFGLDIVEEIASAHDWAVTVKESERGGARFVFSGVTAPDDEPSD